MNEKNHGFQSLRELKDDINRLFWLVLLVLCLNLGTAIYLLVWEIRVQRMSLEKQQTTTEFVVRNLE